MIYIENLTKIFPSKFGDVKEALDGINIHIKENDIFSVIGLVVPGKALY